MLRPQLGLHRHVAQAGVAEQFDVAPRGANRIWLVRPSRGARPRTSGFAMKAPRFLAAAFWASFAPRRSNRSLLAEVSARAKAACFQPLIHASSISASAFGAFVRSSPFFSQSIHRTCNLTSVLAMSCRSSVCCFESRRQIG